MLYVCVNVKIIIFHQIDEIGESNSMSKVMKAPNGKVEKACPDRRSGVSKDQGTANQPAGWNESK